MGKHIETGQASAGPRMQLSQLLRALRLYGDGRVTLGALAWTRTGAGPWRPIRLGSGGRPRGRLLVMPDQEEELRAFCNVLWQRAPAAGTIAWALERFEMGCERPSEAQALSDYVWALRVLLAGPEQGQSEWSADELFARRLAAVCAAPEERAEVNQRVLTALALERSIIEQGPPADGRSEALVRELGEHLRALLRDVICGHLGADLAELADGIIVGASGPVPAPWPHPQRPPTARVTGPLTSARPRRPQARPAARGRARSHHRRASGASAAGGARGHRETVAGAPQSGPEAA